MRNRHSNKNTAEADTITTPTQKPERQQDAQKVVNGDSQNLGSPVIEIALDAIHVKYRGGQRESATSGRTDSKEPGAGLDSEALSDAVEHLRPALQYDGGDIQVVDVVGGDVHIQLLGACGGCPLSEATVVGGIERILRARVTGFTNLIVVTH